MMSFDSRVLGNRILEIAKEKELDLTMMQLRKLVYFAHGWWLTFSNGSPLTKDAPEAWQYGPVYRNLYNAFKGSGSRPIVGKAIDPVRDMEFFDTLPDDVNILLEHVVESYGKFHAFQLSDLTHKPNTPWSQTTERQGYYAAIQNSLIKDHFDDLRQQVKSK